MPAKEGGVLSNLRPGTLRKATLKGVAIALGILAVVGCVVTVLPYPEPPSPPASYLGGRVRVTSSYSSSELMILRAKNRATIYLNPVGWYAFAIGYRPQTVYQLLRTPSWERSFAIGAWIGVAILIGAAFIAWHRSGALQRQ